MRKTTLLIPLSLFVLSGCKTEKAINDYPITPVTFRNVNVKDEFWRKRIDVNKEVTIPIAFSHCETTGRIKNFQIAGGLIEGKFQSSSPFDDSDVSKVIEGAAYSLISNPDKDLEAYVDTIIGYYKAAQEDDGYIYTYRTIMGDDSHPWIGSKRWEKTHILSHELYNLGHMYEAGVAYYEATGKRDLLDICLRSADLVNKDFGWDALKSYPGHQEIEIGLVKLYRTTGDKKYLDLAKFFLDARGKCDFEGNTYDQSHIPVIEQDEAVGHSVRALYQFTAMADVAALTGENSYIDAVKKLWKDIVETKLYITGGVGAAGGHEGFGAKYELPNASAYCETCAAIANVFWNQRMFLMEGDAKYIDVLERSLYNNILSGVAVTGDKFFYPNPLESFNGNRRSEWFGCACCPSNISRFIPDVPGYIYAVKDNNLYVNLYATSDAEIDVDNSKISISQKSLMPWNGKTIFNIDPKDSSKRLSIKLRIPGWARNEVVPGNILYSFKDEITSKPVVRINGKTLEYSDLDKGYLTINRVWNSNDQISVEFPMEILKIKCNSNVTSNIDKIALQRGPIVYCAEGLDNEDSSVLDLVISEDKPMEYRFEENNFNGIMAIYGKANKTLRKKDGSIELGKEVDVKAIPYYAWAHRTPSPMVIWFPVNKEATKPKPAKTIANLSKIDGSVVNRDIEAIRDQLLPAGSNDKNYQFFHWWPSANKTEWITYDFDKPYEISKCKIFWFSDNGGCKAPKSWKLLYKSGSEWKEVKNKNQYGVQLDIINITDFEPIVASAVKLEVDLPADCSSGIHEWIIE